MSNYRVETSEDATDAQAPARGIVAAMALSLPLWAMIVRLTFG